MKANIIIVGVGGQGILLTSKILGYLALKMGDDVKVSEVHEPARRQRDHPCAYWRKRGFPAGYAGRG